MLLQHFQQVIKQEFHLHPDKDKLLLAVSGGVDSIVLTDLLYKCSFDFVIVHCNFQLRGEESERDEIFVRSLKEKYQKKVLIKKFDTKKYAGDNKLSVQESARELRYTWFDEIMHDEKLTQNKEADDWKSSHHSPLTTHHNIYLATAHHADDNIETLLMHFFRGTGIQGLTAIPAFNREKKIIRPLLFAKRAEILQYAKDNNLMWVEDSSNISDKYTRNFFRLQMIPALKEVFPQVEENLLHNIERFKDTEQLYTQAIQHHIKKLLEIKGNEVHIPLLKLQKATPVNSIIWEIIKPYHFHPVQADEVKKLFSAENGSYIASSSHRIIKNRNWLIITPLQSTNAQHILIEAGEKKIQFEKGELNIESFTESNFKISNSNNIAMLAAEEIKFPLVLRRWKQGDYFYPLGMLKKKKLSRFFIDQKLSRTEKENVWVVESNKKIIWIINHRIDNRFKIIPSTKKILRLSFGQKD